MIHRLLALIALLVGLMAPAQASGRFVVTTVKSAEVGDTRITIWLPPGYDAESTRRYPVLYMHDGQNLFDPARSNFNKVWAADKAALGLIESRRVAPFIIVGIDQPGEARYRHYFPEQVLSLPLRTMVEQFVKQPLMGDEQVRFLAEELKPTIDRTYRTRPEPRFTAVAGSSMGGLISLYALAERPDVFGKAAAVSTHSPLIDPRMLASDAALAEAIKADWRRYLSDKLGAPAGRKLWMDHGTATLDASYAPYQAVLDQSVAAAGWARGRDVESRVYEGAEHEENAWAARLPEALAWLLSDWRP